MILKELTDKSDIKVIYKKDVGELPKKMEENVFNLTKMNNNPKTNYYAINIRSRTRQKRSQPTNSYRAS